MANKHTSFNRNWLDAGINPQFATWLVEVPGRPGIARCSICITDFQLSNMGRQAVISHMNSKKHQKACGTASENKSITTFSVRRSAESITPTSDASTTASTGSTVVPNELTAAAVIAEEQQAEHSETSSKPGTMLKYVINDAVCQAEILWSIKLIMSHYSYRSSDEMSQLFRSMFADSEIARKITMGRTKLSYMICHGLAPYFHDQLVENVNLCDEYVICFDEALNTVSQRGQMDLVVRYWNTTKNCVVTQYLTSAFLGHATAEDLLTGFTNSVKELSLPKVIQVSMDGPSVNWKFVKLLSSKLREISDMKLLELGSCGLHAVHGAIQTGHGASGWTVNATLKAMYSLFKDSPARRADFTSVTGSSKFPLKFCQIRWVENVIVAERALEVYPHVKKYLQNTKNYLLQQQCQIFVLLVLTH
jgi:hypothetical protein